MLSNWFMFALIIQYLIVVGAALYEVNYPRALYFFGAVILNVGVLMMGGGGK